MHVMMHTCRKESAFYTHVVLQIIIYFALLNKKTQLTDDMSCMLCIYVLNRVRQWDSMHQHNTIYRNNDRNLTKIGFLLCWSPELSYSQYLDHVYLSQIDSDALQTPYMNNTLSITTITELYPLQITIHHITSHHLTAHLTAHCAASSCAAYQLWLASHNLVTSPSALLLFVSSPLGGGLCRTCFSPWSCRPWTLLLCGCSTCDAPAIKSQCKESESTCTCVECGVAVRNSYTCM